MNHSNLYVPNPQKWIAYFKNKKPQVGMGFAIPQKYSQDDVALKIVTPAQQTVEQAKSELKRDGIKALELPSLVHKLKGHSPRKHAFAKNKPKKIIQKTKSKTNKKATKKSVTKVKKTVDQKQKKTVTTPDIFTG